MKISIKRNKKIIIIFVILTSLFAISILGWNKYRNRYYPERYPYTCTEPGCLIIEDEGKVLVAKRPEVMNLVKTYGRKGVIIEALEYEDIQDKEFVKRLLGENYVELGCIIVVSFPKGQYYYMENDELEVINQLDSKMFNEWLKNSSAEDVNKFYENLH